jgi:hypothetical protein
MATSHPHQFQSSVADESEIHKLVAIHFLLNRVMLQWCPTTSEDLPTPNTNEIMVFSSFFQCRFSLLAYDFFHWLFDHYQIQLVHLNPNTILQITIFFHLCEAFLGIPSNFPLFKNYFFLKCHRGHWSSNPPSHRLSWHSIENFLAVIPRSEKEGTKPPYVCPGCSNHMYSNNMITRIHVQ